MSRSILYLAWYEAGGEPGVHKKVVGTLDAAAAAGFRTRKWSEPFRGVASLVRAMREIARSRESLVLVRSHAWANLFLMPVLIVARGRGQTVVVDVPTPSRVAVQETWKSKQSLWRRVRSVALLYLAGPWSLWPASRIVQYADEGAWFRFGNVRRTVRATNGVDVERTPRRSRAPEWPAGVLCVIGAATIVAWQGYDRVIRAIDDLHRDPARPFDVHFTIAGDGAAVPELKRLAQQLGVERQVTFAGVLTGDALYDAYARAHLAVSAIAIHRKGLTEASPLKSREYCAVGLPFLASGRDPDFPAAVPFRIEVSNDDGTTSVVAALKAFGEVRERASDADIRRYAVEKLDFRHKLAPILEAAPRAS